MCKEAQDFGETQFKDSSRPKNAPALQLYGIYDLWGMKEFRYDPVLGATGYAFDAAPLPWARTGGSGSGGMKRDDKGRLIVGYGQLNGVPSAVGWEESCNFLGEKMALARARLAKQIARAKKQGKWQQRIIMDYSDDPESLQRLKDLFELGNTAHANQPPPRR